MRLWKLALGACALGATLTIFVAIDSDAQLVNRGATDRALTQALRSNDLAREITDILNGLPVDAAYFGAIGDGFTDDGPAFQKAVNALIETGGVVNVAPGKSYVIDTEVTIASRHPIWIVSNSMTGSGTGGSQTAVIAARFHSVLVPGPNLTGSMFKWTYPTGVTEPFDTGGGGIRGLRFLDWDGNSYRNESIVSAVNLDSAGLFHVDQCSFTGILGSAILARETGVTKIMDTYIQRCGDTGKPALQAGADAKFAGINMRDSFIETCYSAAYCEATAPAIVTMHHTYFEAGSTVIPDSNQIFVRGNCRIETGCTFNTNDAQKVELIGNELWCLNSKFDQGPTTNVPTITLVGNNGRVSGNEIVSSSAQVGHCIDMDGDFNTFDGNDVTAGGNIFMDGEDASACNNRIYNSQTTESAVIKISGTDFRANSNEVNTAVANVHGIQPQTGIGTCGLNIIRDLSGSAKAVEGSGCSFIGGIDTNCSVHPIVGHATTNPLLYQEQRVTTDVNAQHNILTAQQIFGGRVTHTSVTGAGNVTTGTAVDIIAGSYGPFVQLATNGKLARVTYINDGAFTLTFLEGVGVTFSVTPSTLAAGKIATLEFTRLTATTVACEVIVHP